MGKRDPDDILREEGVDTLRAIIDAKLADAARESQPNGNGAHLVAPIATMSPFPIDPRKIPRRPWLVPGLLLRRYLSVLVAPPGSGKSLFTLQLGIACALGIDWAGWRPRGKFRVLVINAEDDTDEMQRRLWAAQMVMGLQSRDAELQQNLRLAEDPSSIVIAQVNPKTRTVVRTPMMDRILLTMKQGAYDLAVVDPFAETFEGDENSNSDLKWTAALWREVARQSNAGLMLAHHTRKFGAEAGDVNAARGASALIGIARVVSTLFPMTDDEAVRMNIKDGGRYLRFDDAKANLNLKSPAARWFIKQSEIVPNDGDGQPGDEVGALVPWLPPNPFDNIDAITANKVLDLIAAGTLDDQGQPTGEGFAPTRRGRSNSRWAGSVIVQAIGCGEEDADAILRTWIRNGVLQIVETVIGRKVAKCVKVIDARRPGMTTES